MTHELPFAFALDHSKGHCRTFQTGRGPLEVVYPMDYGHILGLINPEDGEEVDVFRGTGGPHWGRFLKGSDVSGVWKPDEHKWFIDCDGPTLLELTAFWEAQARDLIRNIVIFTDTHHLRRVAADAIRHVGAHPGSA
jgi:hypothetical protein